MTAVDICQAPNTDTNADTNTDTNTNIDTNRGESVLADQSTEAGR